MQFFKKNPSLQKLNFSFNFFGLSLLCQNDSKIEYISSIADIVRNQDHHLLDFSFELGCKDFKSFSDKSIDSKIKKKMFQLDSNADQENHIDFFIAESFANLLRKNLYIWSIS